jgi:hypothetical protein
MPRPLMRAIRLHVDGLTVDELEIPQPGSGEAVARDELTWPVGRLPAIPS